MASCELPKDMIKDLEYLSYVEWLSTYTHRNAKPAEFNVYLEMRGRSWEKALKEYSDYFLEILEFLSIFKHTLKVDEKGSPYVHPLTRNRFDKFNSLISRYLLSLLLESKFDDESILSTSDVTRISNQLTKELYIPKLPKGGIDTPPSIIVGRALERSYSRRFVILTPKHEVTAV